MAENIWNYTETSQVELATISGMSAKERQSDFQPWEFDERLQKWRNMRTGELRDANTPKEEAWRHFRKTGDMSKLRELGII